MHCSGLPGRTSLRPRDLIHVLHHGEVLFRPSRPDFIETCTAQGNRIAQSSHCSGLPGRTSLRRCDTDRRQQCGGVWDCSGLPGRTSLRQPLGWSSHPRVRRLFRPSRPDFIETPRRSCPVRSHQWYCSGLPGRTSLRQSNLASA